MARAGLNKFNVQQARDTLPAALARDAVLDMVAAAYRPGRSMSDAFARLLSALFPTGVAASAGGLGRPRRRACRGR